MHTAYKDGHVQTLHNQDNMFKHCTIKTITQTHTCLTGRCERPREVLVSGMQCWHPGPEHCGDIKLIHQQEATKHGSTSNSDIYNDNNEPRQRHDMTTHNKNHDTQHECTQAPPWRMRRTNILEEREEAVRDVAAAEGTCEEDLVGLGVCV